MYKKILEKIEHIPFEPGCYLFKNTAGEIIYVGKAKSLRKRVRQYFQKELYSEPKIEVMVSQIANLDWVTVKTETESLILEANLIKKYHPKYNKLQKDDKQYVWIKITKEDIPRVIRVREKKRDGAKYFGPFPDGNSARKTMIFLRRLYPYRVCTKRMFYDDATKNRDKFKNDDETVRYSKASRLCLDYHIGLCNGPCDNLVSGEKYNESISEIEEFLKGKSTGLLKSLASKMRSYSINKEYEKAVVVRDRISELNYITQKISIRSGEDEEKVFLQKEKEWTDIAKQLLKRLEIEKHSDSLRIECYDVSNIQGTNPVTSMVVFEKGRPKKSDYRYFKNRLKETPDDYAMMEEGLRRRMKYLRTPLIPSVPAGHLPFTGGESPLVRGEKRETISVSMVRGVANKFPPNGDGVKASVLLQPDKWETKKLPPDKGGWGGYIPYDNQGWGNGESFYKKPDLIIVDGGKGQLRMALEVVESFGLDIPIVGIAKPSRTGGRREEKIIRQVDGKFKIICLHRDSRMLHLVQQLRDEAHRFAITRHRNLRKKKMVRTILSEIPGVGEKSIEKLIKAFGSVDEIRKADFGSLNSVLKNKAKAAEVVRYFK